MDKYNPRSDTDFGLERSRAVTKCATTTALDIPQGQGWSELPTLGDTGAAWRQNVLGGTVKSSRFTKKLTSAIEYGRKAYQDIFDAEADQRIRDSDTTSAQLGGQISGCHRSMEPPQFSDTSSQSREQGGFGGCDTKSEQHKFVQQFQDLPSSVSPELLETFPDTSTQEPRHPDNFRQLTTLSGLDRQVTQENKSGLGKENFSFIENHSYQPSFFPVGIESKTTANSPGHTNVTARGVNYQGRGTGTGDVSLVRKADSVRSQRMTGERKSAAEAETSVTVNDARSTGHGTLERDGHDRQNHLMRDRPARPDVEEVGSYDRRRQDVDVENEPVDGENRTMYQQANSSLQEDGTLKTTKPACDKYREARKGPGCLQPTVAVNFMTRRPHSDVTLVPDQQTRGPNVLSGCRVQSRARNRRREELTSTTTTTTTSATPEPSSKAWLEPVTPSSSVTVLDTPVPGDCATEHQTPGQPAPRGSTETNRDKLPQRLRRYLGRQWDKCKRRIKFLNCLN